MSQIIYTQNSLLDLENIINFLNSISNDLVEKFRKDFFYKIETLSIFPMIGRYSEIKDCRELFLKFGKSYYIVLYFYDEIDDKVIIFSIKNEKELNFSYKF